jgi:CMP-N-acetylneuraminic acid synthetase
LKAWGLEEESNLSLLTKEELKGFAVEYKSNPENKDFVLVPVDAAAISEAAKNFGKKGLTLAFGCRN